MYKIDLFDRAITEALVKKDLEHQAAHTPSGKLSASMLGEPLQWQILKTLGIGQRVVEPYVLRKFARGRDTEDWYVKSLGDVVSERQKFVTYRDAIGYVDVFLMTPVKGGSQILPFEIKSVSNAKFKNIITRRQADENHLLQGAFYAMANGNQQFGLTYIAADDYRTLTWLFNTKDFKDMVDEIITRYQNQLQKRQVPVFEPRYQWQAKLEYCKYPEWMALTQKELDMAMQLPEYRDVWDKLGGGTNATS